MRMRKIVEAKERPTLEAAVKEFLAVKQAQMLSDETMHDDQAQLERFVCGSRNSTEYTAWQKSLFCQAEAQSSAKRGLRLFAGPRGGS